MFFIPYSTDAPIYHWPIATGCIIAANIGIFFATSFQVLIGNLPEEQIGWLLLQYDTINPLQWVTGAFMHADLSHLIGNMVFLWAFGLVVEGKIGSLVFTGIYLLIAALDGAVVQVPMYLIGDEGAALGASGVIFALMLIAMVWAPENCIDCFYNLAWFYSGVVEVRIITLAGYFVMLQIVFLVIGGFTMSSEMLHIIGAAIGAPIGLFMLRNNWVDCEGWDLISRNEWLQEYRILCSDSQRKRMRRKDVEHHDPVAAALASSSSLVVGSFNAKQAAKHQAVIQKNAAVKKTKTSVDPPPDHSQHPEFNRLSFLLRQSIQTNSVTMAQQHFTKLSQLNLAGGLSETTLMAFAKLLAATKAWPAMIEPLQLAVDRQGPLTNQARIRIAQVQWKVNHDPIASQTVLQQIVIPSDQMTVENQKLIALRDQLMREIKAEKR